MSEAIKSGFYESGTATYFVTPSGDVYYVQGVDDHDIPILYRDHLPEDAEPAELDDETAAEYLDALRAATVETGAEHAAD